MKLENIMTKRHPNDSIVSNAQVVYGKKYAIIPVEEIEIDLRYQRSPGDAAVRKLAQKWNDSMYDPVKVIYRENKFFCFDGGHRIAAQIMNGRTEIVCELIEEDSFENEVRRFVTQNECVSKLKPIDTFKGNILLGDPVDTAINDICKEYKVNVWKRHSNSPCKPNCISSIATTREVVKSHGSDCLRWILDILTESGWAVMHAGTSSAMMSTLATLYVKYNSTQSLVKDILIKSFSKPGANPDTFFAAAQSARPEAKKIESAILFADGIIASKA